MHSIRAIRSQSRPVKFLASRALMASGLHRFCSPIQQAGFQVNFDKANLAASLWIDPGHEDDWAHGGWEDYFFRAFLKPGDHVIDVGANIGFTSLLAATITSAPVLAIEAHPDTAARLEANVAANGLSNLITCRNLAAGERTGDVEFSTERADDRRSIARHDQKSVTVPMRRLDDIVRTPDHVALLKIDVEGYELFVLEGAARLLDDVQCVYFESLDEHYQRFGYSGREIHGLLTDAGFTIYKPRRGCVLWPVLDDHQAPIYENLIATRRTDDLLARTNWTLREPDS